MSRSATMVVRGENIMTDTNLPDNPINAEPILQTTVEPLHGAPNEEVQSFEQRLVSLEQKVDRLTDAVDRLTTQQKVATKPKESNETPEKRRTSADRESRIKGALRLYWEAKLDGKPISLKAAAMTKGIDLEPTALSKKYAKAHRTTIDDQWRKLGGYEGMKQTSGITRGKERFLKFVYRTLHDSLNIERQESEDV